MTPAVVVLIWVGVVKKRVAMSYTSYNTDIFGRWQIEKSDDDGGCITIMIDRKMSRVFVLFQKPEVPQMLKTLLLNSF